MLNRLLPLKIGPLHVDFRAKRTLMVPTLPEIGFDLKSARGGLFWQGSPYTLATRNLRVFHGSAGLLDLCQSNHAAKMQSLKRTGS